MAFDKDLSGDTIQEVTGYPKLEVLPRSGNEPFQRHGQKIGANVLDFWRWSASDLLNNAWRGVLAEYIVAHALGVAEGVRTEWDVYDVRTRDNIRVEVKSGAYLQSWAHRKLSPIKFGIRPTRRWDDTVGVYETASKRQADVYVFCVLHHRDKATVNPIDLDQWSFYVASAVRLNEKFPLQKTIRLSVLLSAINPVLATYETLADAVKEASSHSLTAPTQSISISQP